jgi:hypothetical protein
VVTFASCGRTETGRIAVRVGGTPVTIGAIRHWMAIIAAEASTAPGQPTPSPPDPPQYVDCIKYLTRYPPSHPSGEPRPATPGLRAQCEFDYEKDKIKALYALISADWVSGEARDLGVNVAKSEVARQTAAAERQFGGGAAFRRYLSTSRMSASDFELRVSFSLLLAKTQQNVEASIARTSPTAAQRRRAVEQFESDYRQKWTRRTDCISDFRVPLCRQYHPPSAKSPIVPPAIPLTNLASAGG